METSRTAENREVLPDLHTILRDRHLHGVLIATLLIGLLLHAFLPEKPSRSWLVEPVIWVSFLLVHPVIEEWIFRGIIQGELLRRSRSRSRSQGQWKIDRIGFPPVGISHANLITTLLFCLAHFLAQPGGWALAVAVPSLVLGHFRERFGRLSVPIVLHGLFNAVYLLAAIG